MIRHPVKTLLQYSSCTLTRLPQVTATNLCTTTAPNHYTHATSNSYSNNYSNNNKNKRSSSSSSSSSSNGSAHDAMSELQLDHTHGGMKYSTMGATASSSYPATTTSSGAAVNGGGSAGNTPAQHLHEQLEHVMANIEDATANITAETRCKQICQSYQSESMEDKANFLKILSSNYGVDNSKVASLAQSLTSAQSRSLETQQQTQERLRQALVPRYQQLFTQMSRLDHGVKFLVDLRADILKLLAASPRDKQLHHLHLMNSTLRDLLALWFSVGLLSLERVTWQSPCDMVQKISAYEVVHPIRSWLDVKRRVGAYRRCFVFTHSSMPREPLVVLNTALTSHISDSIQSIVRPGGSFVSDPSPSPSPSPSDSSRPNTPPSPPTPTTSNRSVIHPALGTEDIEDPAIINTAIFYSIISTQKGLQGVELGNYLIKKVVRELRYEFPSITQFSSLSPIPGYKDWFLDGVNKILNAKPGDSSCPVLLTKSEIESLCPLLETSPANFYKNLKKVLSSHGWTQNEELMTALKEPLMRLCVHYLYMEKRRGFALNPVANFHLRNGAVMWRVNWKADMSPRGIGASFGLMVNYRYYLEMTEENSINYQEKKLITADKQLLCLLQDK